MLSLKRCIVKSKITDLPVKYVISENGQGHATYGNHYWKKQGATLIGHVDAQQEIDEKGFGGLARMREYAKEYAEDTELINFDITFDDQHEIDLGNLLVIAKEYGSAHSPGDVTVLIPAEKVVLAGDMAFHVRMPPIFDTTDTHCGLSLISLLMKSQSGRLFRGMVDRQTLHL